MPRKKQEVPTVRVPTTLAIGLVEVIDRIIKEDRIYKSRSDFLEKGAFLLVEKVITDNERRLGNRTKSLALIPGAFNFQKLSHAPFEEL